VLYFNAAKGRGKLLGSNRVVYFVHCSAIRGAGLRSLSGGELIEFTPRFGVEGMAACDVARLDEAGGTECDALNAG